MPPRPNPTARQVRLGAELRRLRDTSGIESRDAAAFLGTNQTQISHIEAGRFGISEERLRRLARFYACDDARLVDALVEMSDQLRGAWWKKFRGLMPPQALDIAELEHHASSVRTFEAVHIPGLLQTEEHVRAASLFLDPELPESECETRVEFRMRRQQVLESGTPYNAIIHEAALRMRVGGSKTARAQLEHLLRTSQRETVTIRVIPFSADGFAGAGLPMQYLGGVVPQLDTAQTDTPQGATFTDAPAQLQRCRIRLKRIDSTALTQDASLDLIRHIAQEL
ncbi:helix-turn-helix domain-containing protein [Streptomyces europaeiscabiei]|uniref:Helix-turn-helix transcriptional regulator n=1 Tax=Streptomyces europaeiscabiei TaxID=146819 RepID=A0ABU4NHN1_9ACTN|nr:helix-turn-helix transcriptional regulator [Streptomyces europaeiscabiei]MDX2764639.1 helix-turn-helix transcriptional regulator [Streptomyces europaeiscabiei]MDX3545117.1 helix-turn-helix transcriptional regulator [Streptomyces europaeiscabiei]MDX3554805.1 helix-turn-helix transcriptional regulator [Streptomyces europaeiscabiei]MDX3671778.1 helix-turn-helix transcriptional regulator [Streptomyces europaeiscabiei]MDX3702293.1 helix-turn-helix transcriptional regulator [Streptomyces europaei